MSEILNFTAIIKEVQVALAEPSQDALAYLEGCGVPVEPIQQFASTCHRLLPCEYFWQFYSPTPWKPGFILYLG